MGRDGWLDTGRRDPLGRPVRVRDPETVLAEKTAPGPGGCILWTAALNAHGYGRWSARLSAHRAVWQLRRGPIPAGLHVGHRCDVPACVNIDHLFLCTPAENSADMVRKGRSARNYGVDNPRTKLTDGQVAEARRRVDAGESRRDVGEDYGVSGAYVGRLVSGTRGDRGARYDPERAARIPTSVRQIDVERAAAMYRAGSTLPEIAEALDRNTGALSRALRRAGVAMRTPAETKCLRARPSGRTRPVPDVTYSPGDQEGSS